MSTATSESAGSTGRTGSTGDPSVRYDVSGIRNDFPILSRTLAGGHPLVYLDSANTSQKPQAVIDAMSTHDGHHNANVARAMHQIGMEANDAFDSARATVADFIGAEHSEEVVFTKNASEALNVVARALGDSGSLDAGDEIVISQMEHHSNIVPWQQLCQRTGAQLRWLGLTTDGRLDLSNLDEVISERAEVVSVTWVSNVLGTINSLAPIIERAHEVGAVVVVDASQAVPQMPVHVGELGADFVAFTGHKMLGPTGIGVLWGRYRLLAQLPPFLGGGEMIRTVSMESSTYAPPPHRFEAGTPPITQAVGLAAAVDYLNQLGMDNVAAHEHDVLEYTLGRLHDIDGLTILGPQEAHGRGGTVSFTVDGVHPHDLAQLLDSQGVAVRAGHHCARPVHEFFGVQASARASWYVYTTLEEIDRFIDALQYTKNYFGG